ncbi:UDP-glucose dehydrogenase family protein [candidate division CSSED10-310 bacterium]|uniref:UDP-glucose 6-dehydrogenase n=1 Tax=candidate division CSSED10-310 bacterium TaxID=2855610 RepID=A0ABV6Z0A3_UNCC1
MDMRYSIIGLGKLGASMAAAIAKRGFQVIGVDVNKNAVDLLNNSEAPVQETNLEKTIKENKKRLRATLDINEAVLDTDVSFVIVPTPSDDRGAFSLDYARTAFQSIGKAIAIKKKYHNVVLTSTVLPGSTRFGLLPLLEQESGKVCGRDFGLCYSPEFIALGSVIHDFLNPDFTLVGEFDERAGGMLEKCYEQIMENNSPCKRMTIENAELTKIALNSFVTMKISFANMLANFCQFIPEGDVDVVTDALGADQRIGHKYLKGAIGYGGPCFPRDNKALAYTAQTFGLKADLAETTDYLNRSLPDKMIQSLKNLIKPGMTVAILGLAYKPDSHVVEESQGIYLARKLSEQGIRIVAYDPLAGETARGELENQIRIYTSISECLQQADVVMITIPDQIFKALKADDFRRPGLQEMIVIDFWRILYKKLINQPHITYIPVGRCIDDNTNSNRLAKLWADTNNI